MGTLLSVNLVHALVVRQREGRAVEHDAPVHRVESVVAGHVITNCGRKMRYENVSQVAGVDYPTCKQCR